MFRKEYIFLICSEIVLNINGCLQPVLLKWIIDFIKDGKRGIEDFDWEIMTGGAFYLGLFMANQVFEDFANRNKDVRK